MKPGLWLSLAAVACMTLPAAAVAGGRGSARKQLKWNNFRPKRLGINVAKPTTLKLKRRPMKKGYLAFSGTDTVTGVKFTLYVKKAGRTAAQLKTDLQGLTSIAATKMIPLMHLGAVRGFKWQQSLLYRSTTGLATAVLIARHATRALSFVLVVRVQIGVATTYLADFKKAYFGLRAIP
jgi:hypothetical protein